MQKDIGSLNASVQRMDSDIDDLSKKIGNVYDKIVDLRTTIVRWSSIIIGAGTIIAFGFGLFREKILAALGIAGPP
ncbi:MAG: hypothetical protein AB1405_02080 [Bdellovibrionota bacterium]